MVFMIIFSCGMVLGTGCKRNHYKVNTSSVEADISIKRFDRLSFRPTCRSERRSSGDKRKYGSFLQLFAMLSMPGT